MKRLPPFLSSFIAIVLASARNDDALVTHLPDLNAPALPFKHYSGHLELQGKKERLFYWYAESQNEPANDPIVLWLNGGPGCSSLGGFFTENGPFVVQYDLSVKLNQYSWNRKVNMVWLESPAGVGFSGDVEDRSYYNDTVIAARTREFLSLFFSKFNELENREFYIAGESYAGMYIPYLVDLLVEEPLEGVNLKGFAIGNPFTDNLIDGNAYVDYCYSHALVSLEAYEEIKVHCGAYIGCLFDETPCPTKCEELLKQAEAGADADAFNPYYIYGDKCLLDNTQAKALRKRAKPFMQTSPTHRGDIGACADSLTRAYLNQPKVQEAIHATQPGGQHVAWKDCSDPVGELYQSSPSSLPKYRNILDRDLKALVYSGDADSVVNFIGTERWIGGQGLKLRIKTKWHAWFGPDKQLAGYEQHYEGLTFKTVKGAGHMVPAVRPLHGLHLFECFVFGQSACTEFVYPVDDEEVGAGLTVMQQHVNTTGPLTAVTSVNDESGSSSLKWLALPGACGLIVVLVAVTIRTAKTRGSFQRLYSNGYQTVV
uniref:Carboxypeptidase n=1 Tax=Hyaloperonospora arabidopsidis (strain Emoy2) TaxID=559515 RepID=M4BZR6_HYAAE